MVLKKIEIEILDAGYLVMTISCGTWCYEFTRKAAVSTKESVVELVRELLGKDDETKSSRDKETTSRQT